MGKKLEDMPQDLEAVTESSGNVVEVVEMKITFERYIDAYRSDVDKYQKAYLARPYLGQIRTKSEWDAEFIKISKEK